MVATSVGVTRALPPPWIDLVVAVRADDGDAAQSRGERQHRCAGHHLVAQQHRPGRRRPLGRRPAPRARRRDRPDRAAGGRRRCACRGGRGARAWPRWWPRRPRPARAPPTSELPQCRAGPGISRSSPPSAAPTVLCVANQSDTTTPSQPHSSRRIVVEQARGARCSACRAAGCTPPSSTTRRRARSACSNGRRDTSRSVRSSGSEEIVKRSARCRWRRGASRTRRPRRPGAPSRTPTARWALSTGSSERHSKCRPPRGDRCRFTVGPSSTCAPLASVSAASAAPTRSTSAGSHDAPSAAEHGNDTDGGPPTNRSPRAPLGPSVTLSAGTSPDAATFHQSAPASGTTSSSRSVT